MSDIIMKDKVKDLPIEQILMDLKKFDVDIETVIEELITFYYKNGRHRYSLISQFLIQNAYNQDVLEGLLMRIDMIESFLESNKNFIDERIEKLNYDSNEINYNKFKEAFRKLKDHIELEDYRNKALKKEQELFIERQTKELKEAIEKSKQDFTNKTNILENKLNTGFIGILGIFTAIIIAFFGGIGGINTIFAGLSNPSISSWRIVFFGSLAGVIVFNIIFMFLYFLSKFIEKDLFYDRSDCRKSYSTKPFNIIFILIILYASCKIDLW